MVGVAPGSMPVSGTSHSLAGALLVIALRRVFVLLALLLAFGPADGRAASPSDTGAVPDVPTLEQAGNLPADFLAEAWASLELVVEARAGNAWRLAATRTADRILSGHRSDLGARLHTQRSGVLPHPAVGFRTGYLAARSSAVPPPRS